MRAFVQSVIFIVVCLISQLCLGQFALLQATTTDSLILKQVEFVQTDAAARPGNDEAWQWTQLPFVASALRKNTISEHDVFWFRFLMPEAIPGRDVESSVQSLYIYRHNIRLAVFYGKLFLGGSDTSEGDIKYIGWNHPVLVDLPFVGGEVEPTNEYFYIRVDSGPGGTILSPILIGNKANLEPLNTDRSFFQVEVSRWGFVLCLLMTLLSLSLWQLRQKDSLYLKFAGLSFCTSFVSTFFFLDFIPLNLHVWLYSQHVMSDWIMYFMLAYCVHALEIQGKRFLQCVFVICIAASLIYLLLPENLMQPTAHAIHAVMALIGLGFALAVFVKTYQKPSALHIWFALAFCVMWGFNAHDYYFAFIAEQHQRIAASNWLNFAPQVMAVAFFAHLIYRFSDALNTSESLARNLETRVNETRAQLQVSFAENREMELQRSADEERHKIYRELHDDLGARLVSIVHSHPGENQVSLAKGALESLRESIYRAKYPAQFLSDFIDKMSDEMSLRIEGAGLQFTVEVANLEEKKLSSEQGYHLSRIFRELVSNALQHSQASSIIFDVSMSNGTLTTCFSDDGLWNQGLGHEGSLQSNNGIENIQYRAEQIGAEVAWQDAVNDKHSGMKICLTMAL